MFSNRKINKQCVVYSYKRMVLRADTPSMDESGTLSLGKVARHKKCVHTVWFHLHETLEQAKLICGDLSQNSDVGVELGLTKRHKVWVMWLHVFVKIHYTEHFRSLHSTVLRLYFYLKIIIKMHICIWLEQIFYKWKKKIASK